MVLPSNSRFNRIRIQTAVLCFALLGACPGSPSPTLAITTIIGVNGDATTPQGVCGALSMVQGNAINLAGNEFGAGGIPLALSSDGAFWYTFVGAGAPSFDRVAVNGLTGNTPVRVTSITKYTGVSNGPAVPLSLQVDPVSNRVHLLQTYQNVGSCSGSPPCQSNQVTTGAFTDLGALSNFLTFNNSGNGSFTASDETGVYETWNTSTGGAGVLLARRNGSNGLVADSHKTITYTVMSPIALSDSHVYQAPGAPNTSVFRYTKALLSTVSSINLGFALNTNTVAASPIGVWIERSTFASFCQINLPAFTGCDSTYTWTPATEGFATLWMGYDAVNARLYVLRSDTATGTVPAFLHRFTVSPLAKEASLSLVYTIDALPQPNSVGFSIRRQRITWAGSRGADGVNATINTVGICSSIVG